MTIHERIENVEQDVLNVSVLDGYELPRDAQGNCNSCVALRLEVCYSDALSAETSFIWMA